MFQNDKSILISESADPISIVMKQTTDLDSHITISSHSEGLSTNKRSSSLSINKPL